MEKSKQEKVNIEEVHEILKMYNITYEKLEGRFYTSFYDLGVDDDGYIAILIDFLLAEINV